PLSRNGTGSYAKDSGQAVEWGMRMYRPGQRPARLGHWGRVAVVAVRAPTAREARSYIALLPLVPGASLVRRVQVQTRGVNARHRAREVGLSAWQLTQDSTCSQRGSVGCQFDQ